MTAPNGHPVREHTDPRLVVTAFHDGTVELAGCALCRDPGEVAAMLRQIADTYEAHPVSPPDGAAP